MVSQQRRIVLEAVEKTKAARKSAQRIAYALEAGAPQIRNTLPTPLLPATAEPDETQPILPFQIEERS